MHLTAEARTLCDQLRAEIVRLGWTETANRTGLQRSALHRAFPVDRGARGLSLASAASIAKACGLRLTLTPIEGHGGRDR